MGMRNQDRGADNMAGLYTRIRPSQAPANVAAGVPGENEADGKSPMEEEHG